ncbi:hypothetical protein ACPOL_6636 [Acidisarcina polymorpha]|uniref:Uncharacterized protein n=1 Tax=Acidisarcina polymorpha TaxID=2211140 RepID=A0A2Z5GA20_9BACT|nr:hypothetical protein ACPOL_6636 [Acidisarcina polymorpha]
MAAMAIKGFDPAVVSVGKVMAGGRGRKPAEIGSNLPN